MPYISYRKTGRRTYKRRANGTDVTAAKAVLRYRPSELRVIETVMPVDPSSAGETIHITGISQGDDINDRQGNAIIIRRLICRGSVFKNDTAGNTKLRFVIVRDNFGRTTRPTITSCFNDVAQMFNNKIRLGDPQRMARFTVLWDWYVILENINSAGGALTNSTAFWSMDKKMNSLCMFEGATGTDEGKGCLYMFVASSEATNDPVVAGSCQVWYTDA